MNSFNGVFRGRQFDEDGECYITLHITGLHDREIVKEFQKGLPYRFNAREIKSKRTLEQNAYLWALVHEIAMARDGEMANTESDMQVYCELLRLASAKYYDLYVKETGAIEMLKANVRAVEILESRNNGYIVRCYEGSSKFDKNEMKQLLDYAQQVASQEGIDVRLYE